MTPHHQSTVTRKVVDTNVLQAPSLRDYLAKSAANFAVLTDYAAMESYKGKTLNSIFRRMAILAEFPKQVIVIGQREWCAD